MSDRMSLQSGVLERYEHTAHEIEKRGLTVIRDNSYSFTFRLNNCDVKVYPYRIWFQSVILGTGRGIDNLLNRLDNEIRKLHI